MPDDDGRCGTLGMSLDLSDDEKAALIELLRDTIAGRLA
jgi:dihydrodipicolinate synthase/N-acetylneuraminate lyase